AADPRLGEPAPPRPARPDRSYPRRGAPGGHRRERAERRVAPRPCAAPGRGKGASGRGGRARGAGARRGHGRGGRPPHPAQGGGRGDAPPLHGPAVRPSPSGHDGRRPGPARCAAQPRGRDHHCHEAPVARGDRLLRRPWRVARQGRGLCPARLWRGLRPPHRGQLFQRRRPAARRDPAPAQVRGPSACL
ncbi:MAG: Septum formation protein Maf, partial [uncultured Sphingomonas sp.]